MANSTYYSYGYLISCLVLFIAQFGAADDPIPLLGGKKLIIGVPKKSGFTEFVDAQLSSTNKTQLVQITGYSVDVFNAAVAYLRQLHFNISFEFTPFGIEAGNSGGPYDGHLVQNYFKKYDALVGDVTILANRSKYVDFTLPYVESGVKMLVKVRQNGHLNMWIFLRPFSWDVWLFIVAFCIFIGGSIRFMERKVNRDAGSESSQSGDQFSRVSSLLLPLTQVVLPERESVVKNCSRFVLVVWLILAWILMQSYTANLSSILTLNQLQPSYLTVDELRRNPNINVGFQHDSFVRDLLVNRLNFNASRLKNYSTVDAIFDEVPYVKIFLKQHGSSYAMVGPRYRTDGFGFAFPKGSNLTSYFSRAILNVIESEELDNIEVKYLGSSDDEVQDQSSPSSNTPSLTLYSFAGLFIVTGFLILSAVVVSVSERIWKELLMLATTWFTRSSINASQSGEGSTTSNDTDEGSSSTGDDADEHPQIPSRSLSSLHIDQVLPV